MRRIGILAAVLFCMFACGCNSMQMSASEHRSKRLHRYPRPPTETKLQPGDRIKIQIQTTKLVPEVLSEVVDERGNVKMPIIGLIGVGGMTPSAAERKIEEEYVSRKIFKREGIQIAIVPPVSEFYVQGFVRRPGSYQFTRSLTVLNAIALAGGPTEFAHPRDRTLMRGGQVILMDAKKVRAGDEVDLVVQPGDRIEVPRGTW